jgi:hypothetical protein
MSKDFSEVAFDHVLLKKELDAFGGLLDSEKAVAERRIQELFKKSLHLTAFIGATFRINIGVAKHVAYEFEIIGDYAADVVLGTRDRRFCLVELEPGIPSALLRRVGRKSSKEWSREFEHGFSQIVDWFCHLDDFKNTEKFRRNFGHAHIEHCPFVRSHSSTPAHLATALGSTPSTPVAPSRTAS